jgi:phage anti-repressor protein
MGIFDWLFGGKKTTSTEKKETIIKKPEEYQKKDEKVEKKNKKNKLAKFEIDHHRGIFDGEFLFELDIEIVKRALFKIYYGWDTLVDVKKLKEELEKYKERMQRGWYIKNKTEHKKKLDSIDFILEKVLEKEENGKVTLDFFLNNTPTDIIDFLFTICDIRVWYEGIEDDINCDKTGDIIPIEGPDNLELWIDFLSAIFPEKDLVCIQNDEYELQICSSRGDIEYILYDVIENGPKDYKFKLRKINLEKEYIVELSELHNCEDYKQRSDNWISDFFEIVDTKDLN